MMKKTASAVLSLLFVFTASVFAEDVRLVSEDELGSYLADSEGRTLYYFRKDSPGMSACYGGCASLWPPFHAESPALPEGLDPGDFGSIERDDGKAQTTFRGYPLYYYSGDEKPGDAKGHGRGSLWFVVHPDRFMR